MTVVKVGERNRKKDEVDKSLSAEVHIYIFVKLKRIKIIKGRKKYRNSFGYKVSRKNRRSKREKKNSVKINKVLAENIMKGEKRDK
jgi:hypothetical protein